MFSLVRRFIKNESGATAIEYGLIAALVSVAAIVALGLMGDSLSEMFGQVCTSLVDSMDSATTVCPTTTATP